jgi:hypothetical protein
MNNVSPVLIVIAIAGEVRKMCHRLRWEVVSDTVAEPSDLASL